MGDQIRAAREKKGILQRDVALKLGVDRTAITKIENGDRNISGREVKILASLLGLRLDSFLSGNWEIKLRSRGGRTGRSKQ